MSKELEALRNFISECENDWKTQPKRWVNRAINSNVSKYMDSLKSILTPPTAEEVCGKKLELYKRLFNVCKEYKHTSIGLSDDSEFLNVMSELEEELK